MGYGAQYSALFNQRNVVVTPGDLKKQNRFITSSPISFNHIEVQKPISKNCLHGFVL